MRAKLTTIEDRIISLTKRARGDGNRNTPPPVCTSFYSLHPYILLLAQFFFLSLQLFPDSQAVT
jgi:hypothetical protein